MPTPGGYGGRGPGYPEQPGGYPQVPPQGPPAGYPTQPGLKNTFITALLSAKNQEPQ